MTSLPFRATVGSLIRLGLGMLVLATVCTACEQPPAADSLKTWTRDDHHSSDDDKLAAGEQSAPTARADKSGDGGEDYAQLVDLAWRQQCTSCHGPRGKGDGPMGAMLRAPDLTRSDWQSTVADTDIAATIATGRNKMPRFDFPAPVIQGLVSRIRSLRER